MITNAVILYALRTQLATLSVATTGATAISATATGYARAAGSFVTDGFEVGMEVVGTSFTTTANNTAKIVTAVSALTLTATGTAVEAVGTRTLTVGLPALRASENVKFDPVGNRWYVEEDYLPGPGAAETLGPLAELEYLPLYVVKLYGVANRGPEALYAVADGVLALFPPRKTFTLSTGDVLRVRADVTPTRGPLLQSPAGAPVIVCSVPCRIRTANAV